jgi:putative transposase
VVEAMKKLSGIYPRFGSRRIRIFLQRDGIFAGKERCGRLWAKAGLQVPKKRRRKRAGTTLRLLAPTAKNSVWSYDFLYDACANGQKIKCLTVVDEYTPECLAIDVSGAIRSSHVIEC